jgi:hypothetical protein
MADSSLIDNALMAKLGADATLLSYCPNGVYWDLGPDGMTRFVVVSLVEPRDEEVFGATAFEDTVYSVKAVMRKDANGNIAAAAARIHDLLHDQTLTVSGYTHMVMYRNEEPSRIRITERDDVDGSIIWYHRGGFYRVQQSIP